jgi:hypothetical protein
LRASALERSSARVRKLSRTVRKKRSIFPLAAPSRTGAWQRSVPMRAQTWEISLEE